MNRDHIRVFYQKVHAYKTSLAAHLAKHGDTWTTPRHWVTTWCNPLDVDYWIGTTAIDGPAVDFAPMLREDAVFFNAVDTAQARTTVHTDTDPGTVLLTVQHTTAHTEWHKVRAQLPRSALVVGVPEDKVSWTSMMTQYMHTHHGFLMATANERCMMHQRWNIQSACSNTRRNKRRSLVRKITIRWYYFFPVSGSPATHAKQFPLPAFCAVMRIKTRGKHLCWHTPQYHDHTINTAPTCSKNPGMN